MRDMVEDTGPFHEGELAVQRATGERAVGASNGRIIVDHVLPNAVGFIARQELAVVASIDGDGQPWSSALLGPAGSFTGADLDHGSSSTGTPCGPTTRCGATSGRPPGRPAVHRGGVPAAVPGQRAGRGPRRRPARRRGRRGLRELPEVHLPPPLMTVRPRRPLTTPAASEPEAELGDGERSIIAAADVLLRRLRQPRRPPGRLPPRRPTRVRRSGTMAGWACRTIPATAMFTTLGNLRPPSAGRAAVHRLRRLADPPADRHHRPRSRPCRRRRHRRHPPGVDLRPDRVAAGSPGPAACTPSSSSCRPSIPDGRVPDGEGLAGGPSGRRSRSWSVRGSRRP